MNDPAELQRATLIVLDRISLSIEESRVSAAKLISGLIDYQASLSEQVALLSSRIESLERLNRQLIEVTLSQSKTIEHLIEAQKKR